jgi:N-acetylglucosaminyl-diphospho-decaprenol L-rhamnosyltransferase
MALVDVVVVSYNSRDRLRACVEPLTGHDDIQVIVVDNASPDGSLESIADLPIRALPLSRNGGFARGCNAGWSEGTAPFVLFLNPDAVIEPASVRRLAATLEKDDHVGAVGPKILNTDGSLDLSQRCFGTVASTFAEAFFLHRLFPGSDWADSMVNDPRMYERRGSPDWISGSCMLVRRSALEQLDGWDEGFFLYCEDMDLCRRLRNAGFDVRYEPEAVAVHEGGASTPHATTTPILADSRLRYAEKHFGRGEAVLDRLALILRALTRIVVARGGFRVRAAHLRALRLLVSGGRLARP